MSVISLLSTDPPNIDSPANLDAAKEVRENLAGELHTPSLFVKISPLIFCTFFIGYRKKVRRLARRSAEEAFD